MSNDAQLWKACPPGELTRLGRRLRGKHRRRLALKAGGMLAAVIATFGLFRVYGPPQENSYAGLTCSEVKQLAMPYQEGKLAPDLQARVRSHVEQCERCHELFQQMGLASLPEPDRWIHAVMLALGSSHREPNHGRTPVGPDFDEKSGQQG